MGLLVAVVAATSGGTSGAPTSAVAGSSSAGIAGLEGVPGGGTTGQTLFTKSFEPRDGLGPLYNQTSCVACHTVPVGGMSKDGLSTVLRVGRLTDGGFDPMGGRGGPVARAHSVSELGLPCGLAPGIPAGSNVTSVRNTPTLFGNGLIDSVPDDVILAETSQAGDGVHGRANMVRDLDGRARPGRFGWKAATASLRVFVAEAFRNELGLTNPLAPTDVLPSRQTGIRPCAGESARVELDEAAVDATTSFVAALPPPTSSTEPPPRGGFMFAAVGCAACHRPSLPGADGPVPLYSDLLLHDMGPELDDGVVQGDAQGADWRTTPLWGVGSRQRLLHDGRATTLEAAITAHGGEADTAKRRFRELGPDDRQDLLAFLRSL